MLSLEEWKKWNMHGEILTSTEGEQNIITYMVYLWEQEFHMARKIQPIK